MPAVGGKDQRASCLTLRFRQIVHIAVGGVGADRPGKDLRHVGPQLVHRRHDDVARVFIVELLDAFAEVGFDDLDAD